MFVARKKCIYQFNLKSFISDRFLWSDFQRSIKIALISQNPSLRNAHTRLLSNSPLIRKDIRDYRVPSAGRRRQPLSRPRWQTISQVSIVLAFHRKRAANPSRESGRARAFGARVVELY